MINYKNIGSKLTDNEFNGIIHLLKKNTVLYDEISLENNNIVGTYANYNLSLNIASILDNGILIVNNSYIGTIELKNRLFADATYTLKLTVFFKDNETMGFNDDAIETELEIVLKENTPVNIDFNTIGKQIIVGFNALVVISFNEPLIIGNISKKVKGNLNWQDNDNQDGNRPESVVVNLYADGAFIESLTVTEEDNWQYAFENLEIYNGDNENIIYSVNTEPVGWYLSQILGYDVNFQYQPEITDASARVVWQDNNNENRIRPTDVTLTLSNGETFTLNEGNGWTITLTDLPTTLNHESVNYSWTIGDVIGYTSSVETNGDMTLFILTLITRPPNPDNPKTPKTPGDNPIFDDYDEPL